MLARTLGYGLSGVNGFAVKVEVYAASGIPALEIIGLPDASVKESRDRVSAAIVNSGFAMPIARLTVNLAPADLRKEGPAFDLPIAVSVLMASHQMESLDLSQTLLMGELSLEGSLQAVRGAKAPDAQPDAREEQLLRGQLSVQQQRCDALTAAVRSLVRVNAEFLRQAAVVRTTDLSGYLTTLESSLQSCQQLLTD